MKIKDLKVVYICPDHNEKYKARKEHMNSMMTRIGFHDFEHFKSSTEDYPDCLSKATIDILTKYMDCPVLILEDDVEFTGIGDFDMFCDVDAIYFGLSTSAGHPTNNIHHGPAMYTCYSKTQVRILNMLSAHAILYISPSYKQAVINTLKEKLGQKLYNDVLISRLHASYLILANRKPSFYQAALFNKTDHEERHTKIEFNDKQLSSTVVTAFYPMKSKHSMDHYMQWSSYLCKIPCSLVIFTDEQMVPIFTKLRKGLPTRIIIKPFYSYELTSPSWMDIWKKHYDIDPEKKMHTPELYAVWAIKQECISLTIQNNPYETDYFVWCDIGIHRDLSQHKYYYEFPVKVPEICKPGHIGFLEIRRIPDCFISDATHAKPDVTLGGGCIVGDKAAWKLFCNTYKHTLSIMDARGEFIGKDQNVYFQMLIDRAMMFQLFYTHACHLDIWMQLPCILAGTIPIVLDERFTS